MPKVTPTPVLLSLVVLTTLGCRPLDGAVFVDDGGDGSGGASGGVSNSVDGIDAIEDEACFGDEVRVLHGNDPRFSHECGESCDTDWCGCDPCLFLAGPIGRLPAGPRELMIQTGSSGLAEFDLRIFAEDGTTIHDETLTYDGLNEHRITIDVPTDCRPVFIEWEKNSALCFRLYEIFVNPDQ